MASLLDMDALESTYDDFGIQAIYGGNEVLVMRDTGFEVDDLLSDYYKILARDVQIQKVDGRDQLVHKEITIGSAQIEIVDFMPFGNDGEEIVLVLAGDRRE